MPKKQQTKRRPPKVKGDRVLAPVEDARRTAYLAGLNVDYAKLRADAAAWADYEKELRMWDSTNLDGLEHL